MVERAPRGGGRARGTPPAGIGHIWVYPVVTRPVEMLLARGKGSHVARGRDLSGARFLHDVCGARVMTTVLRYSKRIFLVFRKNLLENLNWKKPKCMGG